jgi:hypothetical protein
MDHDGFAALATQALMEDAAEIELWRNRGLELRRDRSLGSAKV